MKMRVKLPIPAQADDGSPTRLVANPRQHRPKQDAQSCCWPLARLSIRVLWKYGLKRFTGIYTRQLSTRFCRFQTRPSRCPSSKFNHVTVTIFLYLSDVTSVSLPSSPPSSSPSQPLRVDSGYIATLCYLVFTFSMQAFLANAEVVKSQMLPNT
ncbi:hypothetical protein BJ165DRAFT_415224 [Panaeolus papilionaceus]|nr:hypothetical protein BJ165DRAFT_415224 [Panaeolus papilionaceus]